MGITQKVSLWMKFIGGQVGKSNKSTMLGGFSSFPHGFELSRRATSMIKMNPWMGNWWCHDHRVFHSFKFPRWIPTHHEAHCLSYKHWPIILFIKFDTFYHHHWVHKHLWMLVMDLLVWTHCILGLYNGICLLEFFRGTSPIFVMVP